MAVYTPAKILVYPHLHASRMQVSALFYKFLAEHCYIGRKLSRGVLTLFLSQLSWASAEIKCKTRCIRRWHALWLRSGAGHRRGLHRRRASDKDVLQKQRKRIMRSMPCACPWVRDALYEWFASMRYSIDWKAVTGSAAPQLRVNPLQRNTYRKTHGTLCNGHPL